MVITSRERELGEQYGRNMNARPRYVDEPRSEVVVALNIKSMQRDSDKDSKE
jgi:hypothetical protein